MNKINTVKGFADHLPEEALQFVRMGDAAREVFSRYGYREIHVPILEYTELFARSIGADTDVVRKEMFTFPDRKERSLTMRPEATAGIMRSYIENNIYSRESLSKFFTFGPMFRYERPQKGRLRQFHQVNCECLGVAEARVDAEIILMLMHYLRELDLVDITLELNTLGCARCRPAYKELLLDFIRRREEAVFCEDCRRRLRGNPLRVLDCKEASCRAAVKDAPAIADAVCPECRGHFDAVRALLEARQQPYILNPRLVRGLDYYCRTTFEVVSGHIGAQTSIAGGGRYDGLAASLGGPEAPGVGFACGMERLALIMPPREAVPPDFYIALLDERGGQLALTLAQDLREAGFSGNCAFSAGSLKNQLRAASRLRAGHCLILGENELVRGVVLVKNMENGAQTEEEPEGIGAYLRRYAEQGAAAPGTDK
jgi:histidyl-tRNA synthetase